MNQSIIVNITPDELTLLIETSVRTALAGYQLPQQPAHESELMSVTQLMNLLGVVRSTIYSYVHYLKIPFHKKSGKLYFKRSDIMKWMESGRHMSADEIIAATDESLAK